MSTGLREIRRRIGSTRQIRQVTGALQRVSSARLNQDRRIMETSRRYTEKLVDILGGVIALAPDPDHPLLRPRPEAGAVAVLVFGSEKGLCGGFNGSIIEALGRFRGERPNRHLRLFIVGKAVARRAQRAGYAIEQRFTQPARGRRAEALDALTSLAVRLFETGGISETWLAYVKFVSVLRQEPVIDRILPVPRHSARAAVWRAALCEPAPEAILGHLLPELLRQSVDHAFLSSMAAENAARQEAMGRASENARELLGELTIAHSRLRQEDITTQMLEIACGDPGRTPRSTPA